jgi:pyridinium-3,5-biscarboxylic acid mononucleotide synthase
MSLRALLERVADGSVAPADAERELDSYGFIALGYQKLDVHRSRRSSIPEVVLGQRKSVAQMREIVAFVESRDLPILITKIDPGAAKELCGEFSALVHEPVASIVRRGTSRASFGGVVGVVTGGSSDVAVAEEAAATLEFFGVEVVRAYDCGVAGLHRLFAEGERLRRCDVLIAVAGMEGALPSVLAGLFDQPLVAVPTSVGYGANFEGLSALLTMLNSCAPGISVVNIDNGFGAAACARSMLAMASKKREREDGSREGAA